LLNSFAREAIKKKENAPACNVIYCYKALVRRLLGDRPDLVPPLVHYMRYYAEFARARGLPFVYERLSYELVELSERAYERAAAPARELLDAVLAFDASERSVGLVKSRAILAGYLLERGLTRELDRVRASLLNVPSAVIEQAKCDLLVVRDRLFWELSDQGVNFDYLEPVRRERVVEFLDGLTVSAVG
jgi:nucleotide-binding universal stress UspA family protein